jgi:hypothetical protein
MITRAALEEQTQKEFNACSMLRTAIYAMANMNPEGEEGDVLHGVISILLFVRATMNDSIAAMEEAEIQLRRS